MYTHTHAAIKYRFKVLSLSPGGNNTPYYCITHPGATLLRLQGGDLQSYTPYSVACEIYTYRAL